MNIVEEHYWDGKPSVVVWRDAGFKPPIHMVTQSSGICFTDDGYVVLVSVDGNEWSLPGGHTEKGETIEDTLIREVREEACARIVSLEYLGAQEVQEKAAGVVNTHYQVRFWARVQLDEFKQNFEIKSRKLVEVSKINDVLHWNPSGILEAIVRAAVTADEKYTQQIGAARIEEGGGFSLDHIAVTVTNLETSIDFYTGIFGFSCERIIELPNAAGRIALLVKPDITIEMFQFSQASLLTTEDKNALTNLKVTGVRHLALRVKDVPKTAEYLRKNGVEFLSQPATGTRGYKRFFIKDPDGIPIELSEGPDSG
ncbi:MAG: VOC family protein [Dehalococcoidales bacterium]|nr:VOC family protein [Dehalococcoidales bacterium]